MILGADASVLTPEEAGGDWGCVSETEVMPTTGKGLSEAWAVGTHTHPASPKKTIMKHESDFFISIVETAFYHG
jgi:hypothetical protein